MRIAIAALIVLAGCGAPAIDAVEPVATVTAPVAVTTAHQVPDADQGEGGPDRVPAPAWLVPADQCTDVRTLLARHDLIGPTADRLTWIAQRESDCGLDRVNKASQDYGIWQINWPTWGGPLCRNAGICSSPWELAHDDDVQAEAVAVLLEWQGWSAWCWSTPEHHARGIGYECPWGIEEQG